MGWFSWLFSSPLASAAARLTKPRESDCLRFIRGLLESQEHSAGYSDYCGFNHYLVVSVPSERVRIEARYNSTRREWLSLTVMGPDGWIFFFYYSDRKPGDALDYLAQKFGFWESVKKTLNREAERDEKLAASSGKLRAKYTR